MAKCYQKFDGAEMKIVQVVMKKHHPDLVQRGVTVDCLFVFQDGEKSGEHTLKFHGYPAAAVVRKVPLKDRVKGAGDAEIVFDLAWWSAASEEERVAVIDHELTHLEVKRNKNTKEVETDDHGRPVLKLKLHDIQFGGFTSIVKKHGQHAPEAQAAKQVQDQWGQLLMWSMDTRAVG